MYGDFSGSPLYNPNINPFMQAYGQNPYAQQPKQEVVKVNGENGARAFPIGANSSALLLDESGELVWLVVTDGAGYKTVMPYDITPHKAAPTPDFSTLEQRIERLEEKLNAYSTDSSAAWNENSAVKPEYCSDPATNESRSEREGRRSTYAPDDRKQSSVHANASGNAGSGQHT